MRYIKLGQIWKFPIMDDGMSSGVGGFKIHNKSDITGFYRVSRKHSNEMWQLTRLFTTPVDVKVEKDSLHNNFWHKNFIVQCGEFVGDKEANLHTIKLLYTK